MNSLLGALRAVSNISSDEGEEFFRNEKLDTKWRSRQTKSSKDKSRTAMVISSPKHKILGTRVYSPFTFVLS